MGFSGLAEVDPAEVTQHRLCDGQTNGIDNPFVASAGCTAFSGHEVPKRQGLVVAIDPELSISRTEPIIPSSSICFA